MNDSFVVLVEKRGIDFTVEYSQVKQIKGRNGVTAAEVAINVGKAALVVAGVAAAFTVLALIFIPKT